MEFKIGDYNVRTRLIGSETKKSKHTDNDLETLEVSFRADVNFEIPEFVYSVDTDKKWKARISSTSHTSGNPYKTYNLELEEVEEWNIENIIINGFKFKPYFYEEEISYDKRLSIKANLKVDEDNWDIIKDFIYNIGNVIVIREGISDKEIEMHFGHFIWSKNDGEYKCRINLFEEDNSKSIALFRPEMDNIKTILLHKSNTIDKLLALLLEKGIINDLEMEKIQKEEKDMDRSIFNETKDLDKFFEVFN